MTEKEKNKLLEMLTEKVNFHIDQQFDLLVKWKGIEEQIREQLKKKIEHCIKREFKMLLP